MNIEQWQHHHSFGENKQHIEKKTLIVVLITFSMMIAEIIFGLLTNSMALLVALVGLTVNLASAFILNTGKSHHHEHHHNDSHDHSHEDLNLKSAYLHVIADAMISVFAIVALLAAKYFNLLILDPIMGIVGAVLITRWAFTLLRDSSRYLLDYNTNNTLTNKIKDAIESDKNIKISDLHLWKVADNSYSCIISLVSNGNYTSKEYKNKLLALEELAHVTIEINRSK